MSRINTLLTGQTEMSLGWMEKNHDQITKHPAWMGDITEAKANWYLERKNPFTYLLRNGEKDYTYFISFIQKNGSIKHQYFTLESDRKGWYYKNGVTTGPAELICSDLKELIPQMMHCDLIQCIVLEHSHI